MAINIDPTQIVLDFLNEASDFKTALGSEIWSPKAGPSSDKSARAVVFSLSESELPNGLVKCQGVFRCYGSSASYKSARETGGLLKMRLHENSGRVASGEIRFALLTDRSLGPSEPDTGRPVEFSFYEITVGE